MTGDNFFGLRKAQAVKGRQQMKRKWLFSANTDAILYRSTLGLSQARVDRAKGIIFGVSIVSQGPVKGYKQTADSKTLDQVVACIKEYDSGLRIKFNSKTWDHGPGALVARIPGESLRIKGKQALGDVHFYKSAPKEDLEMIYEMAETSPDHFGLSIEFNGVPEEIGEQKFARCDEIFAAAIVDIPAANATGLFRKGNGDETTEDNDMDAKLLKEIIDNALKPLQTELTALKAKIEAPDGANATAEECAGAGVLDTDSDDEKAKKVSKFRADLKKPATVGDVSRIVMQQFRLTGGKPAKGSGGEGAGGGDKKPEKGTSENFKALEAEYAEAGATPGVATFKAKKDDPKGYNAFRQEQTGQPEKKEDKKK